MMNKISLCPFCASSHTFTHDALHNQYAVRCSICNAIGPDMPTIVGAIASWNKRAVQSIESPPLPEPDCGDDFINAFGGYQMHAYAAQAVAAERERCAQLCEGLREAAEHSSDGLKRAGAMAMAASCAKMMRAPRIKP